MSVPILATKLFLPQPHPNVVLRPRLMERLNAGRKSKLTIISAPAGFGKTTLLSEWLADYGRSQSKDRIAWLSLDEEDNNSARFLTYLIAALQTVTAGLGEGVMRALETPQPPPMHVLLTNLLNEIASIADHAPLILILDDYHVIDSHAVNQALAFLVEHQPPQMHLIIASREDPPLPLARYRARGQVTELRAADMRFTPSEAAAFLTQRMGLNLSTADIAALDTRTEGWIAGLQLAALALQGSNFEQGHADASRFIQSFTGSHRFILDYLVQEVLEKQPEAIQSFLLETCILNRMCGPLCDAVCSSGTELLDQEKANGQQVLEYLERANLFIVPLDDERRWYRYHHLFAELLRQLLRQRLHQRATLVHGEQAPEVAQLHVRASQWFEAHDFVFEAFHHAAAANDVARAERLIESGGLPLHYPGAVTTVLNWLDSLPKAVLDARPSLWVRYASLSLVIGITTGVEEKLQAAEAALQGVESDAWLRNLLGIIAAARATLALTRYQVDTMITQSQRALSYLHTDNLSFRATAFWTLGIAFDFQGDRTSARRAFIESLSLSQASGSTFTMLLATISLGQVQEYENQLYQAAESYRRALQLSGDPALTIAYEAHLGLARIYLEWNDLNAAQYHGQKSLELAQQYDRAIDRSIACEVFLARLHLAQGDATGAAALIAKTEQSARQQNFLLRMPEIAAAQALILLYHGDLAAADQVAKTYDMPLLHARVLLALGNTSAALGVLASLRLQMQTKGWQDELLRVMVLQAVALHAHGEKEQANQQLVEALTLAEPGGFVRLFLEEGLPVKHLLQNVVTRGIASDYPRRLQTAFSEGHPQQAAPFPNVKSEAEPAKTGLVEPISERELEILRHLAQGRTNPEIASLLYLSLNTVKVHTRNIYGKLGVNNRTQAVARARALGLLPLV